MQINDRFIFVQRSVYAEDVRCLVMKNKKKPIVGFWNKLMRISTAWIPTSWKLHFIAKRWSKISKDAF